MAAEQCVQRTAGIRRVFQALFWRRVFPVSAANSPSALLPLTPTVMHSSVLSTSLLAILHGEFHSSKGNVGDVTIY